MNTNKADVAAIILNGSVGAIPFIGSLAAEIVGAIIPNQRIDRIESLLRLLEARILENDQEKVKQRIVTPEYVDLIEDGFWQAARALSEERKDYIASLLKNSLTDDELKYIEYKRLMSILGELNDLEILILKSKILYLYPTTEEQEEFWKMHGQLLKLPSTKEGIDKQIIYGAHTQHLVNLRLLIFKDTIDTSGLSKVDRRTKEINIRNYDITRLGKLLLRSIDQAASENGA